MIAMPTYERWSNNKKLNRLNRHIWKQGIRYPDYLSTEDSYDDDGIYERVGPPRRHH